MDELQEILSLAEAAERAGVSRGRLLQLIEAGRLRGRKIGNSWAVLARDVDGLVGRSLGPGRPDERDALQSRLVVDLRPQSPIQIQLAYPPHDIRLWFRVDNRSNVEVELDRLLVEVWYPQPVAEGSILHRHTIGPNQLVDTLMFHAFLSQDMAETMRRYATDRTQYTALKIYAHAYFNTQFGTGHVQATISRERGEFPIQLPPS